MSFQTLTNQQPAPAVAGDFASKNPRATVLAGPGGLVAGAAGVTVGRFAWYDLATATLVSNTGIGAPNGFVANEHRALITTYLAETSYVIPAGFEMTMFDAGDFWAKNDGTVAAVLGQKVYASNATGQLIAFAATGAPPTGGTGGSTSAIAPSTFSVTASIGIPTPTTGPGTNPGILTVTVVGSGTVVPGATISGTGVQTGTQVTSQILPLLAGETAGGVGRYGVTIPQTTASTTVSGTYGTMTIAATVTGTFAVGDTVTGANVTAGTYITALGTGTGGAGTYIVSPTQTAAAAAISAYSATETGFYVRSQGQPGELIKISSRAMG